MNYDDLASDEAVAKTKQSLENNGFTVFVVDDGAAAKVKVLELIPEGSEVMNMTSVTLDTIGLPEEINESGKFDSVRNKFKTMGEDQAKEKRQLGAAPDYSVGSVHAVSQDGSLFIASKTGSQLPAYAYGAGKAIWVVSTKKIVLDHDSAIKRIYEHVLPLESERANKAYNTTTGSFVSKLLIINKEIQPGRATVILVKEKLGF